MITSLLQIDQQLFELINGQWHLPFLDWLMPWWREKTTWIPAYLLLAAYALYRFRKRGILLLLGLILAVGAADAVSSHILKPTVHRLRPCNDPQIEGSVRLLTGCGKAYSFTSSHAANHFAIAAFLSLTLGIALPWLRPVLYLWAGSIAYGQVYVGVHYPADVLAGAILGLIIGNIVAKTYLRVPYWRMPEHQV